MTAYFEDSQFLAAAWIQLLETKPQQVPIFKDGERIITAREVLAVLRKESVDLVVAKVISGYFKEVMVEAMQIVRGRFASGLDSSKKNE